MPYAGKAAAQAVGAVVHRPHSVDDPFAGHPAAFSVKSPRQWRIRTECAPDPLLSLVFLPFVGNRKTKASISTQTVCLRQNERLCPFASIIHPFLHIVKRKTQVFAKKSKKLHANIKNLQKGVDKRVTRVYNTQRSRQGRLGAGCTGRHP